MKNSNDGWIAVAQAVGSADYVYIEEELTVGGLSDMGELWDLIGKVHG